MVINKYSSKEIVLAAANKSGLAFQYASERLQNDKKILDIMFNKYGESMFKKNKVFEIYQDLKLKENMANDLIKTLKVKSVVKKF